jgi:type III secretion protein S
MAPQTIIDLSIQALILVLMLSLPTIIVTVIAGILVGMLQAVTQIQDQSISHGVKVICAIVSLVLTISWAGSELHQFAYRMFTSFTLTK